MTTTLVFCPAGHVSALDDQPDHARCRCCGMQGLARPISTCGRHELLQAIESLRRQLGGQMQEMLERLGQERHQLRQRCSELRDANERLQRRLAACAAQEGPIAASGAISGALGALPGPLGRFVRALEASLAAAAVPGWAAPSVPAALLMLGQASGTLAALALSPAGEAACGQAAGQPERGLEPDSESAPIDRAVADVALAAIALAMASRARATMARA